MNKTTQKDDKKFAKEQILKSEKYKRYRDLPSVLLTEKMYAKGEIDKLIDGYLKRGVK